MHRRHWVYVILSMFQSCFVNVEATLINVHRLNFHFQPNISNLTTSKNVDDWRHFNVNSTLMCLLGCFNFPSVLLTGIPNRGRDESHSIHAIRIFYFLALVISDNCHINDFTPALSFQGFEKFHWKRYSNSSTRKSVCRDGNDLTYSCAILFTLCCFYILSIKQGLINVLQDKDEDVIISNENQPSCSKSAPVMCSWILCSIHHIWIVLTSFA